MAGKLYIHRWLHMGTPVHAVALSGDGRLLAVGSEGGLHLRDLRGQMRGCYTLTGRSETPFTVVAMTPDAGFILAGVRTGELYLLEVAAWTEEELDAWPREIFYARNDLYSLALTQDGGRVVVGHLGPALTCLNGAGKVLWWKTTDRRTWAVALSRDGDTLFAAPSGPLAPLLAALETRTGTLRAVQHLEYTITALVALQRPSGVAAAITDGAYRHSLACYAPSLNAMCWEREWPEQITALAADERGEILVCGYSSEGYLGLARGSDGGLVAECGRPLGSVITSVAMAGGCYVIAGLANGNVVSFIYTAEGDGSPVEGGRLRF